MLSIYSRFGFFLDPSSKETQIKESPFYTLRDRQGMTPKALGDKFKVHNDYTCRFKQFFQIIYRTFYNFLKNVVSILMVTQILELSGSFQKFSQSYVSIKRTDIFFHIYATRNHPLLPQPNSQTFTRGPVLFLLHLLNIVLFIYTLH